jgi:hypothetical protein
MPVYISCVRRSESIHAPLHSDDLLPFYNHFPGSPRLIAAPVIAAAAGLRLSESALWKRSPCTRPRFRISVDHCFFAVVIQFLSEPDWQRFRFLVGRRIQWHDNNHDSGQQFSNNGYHYILDDFWPWQLQRPGTDSRRNVGRFGLLKWRQQFDPDTNGHLTFWRSVL